jgi:uncharacterized protein YlxP (DUF503 family)
MIVSRMMFEVKLTEGYSLKDRRRVEKSLSDSLRRKYNVSLIIQRDDYPLNLFTLYIAQVNEKLSELDRVYERILQRILEMDEIELIKTEFEILS